MRRTSGAVCASLAALALTAVPALAGEWTSFDGGPDTTCADGSEVHFLERVAEPTKVVLYFEGGGACFSAETCAFADDAQIYTSSSDYSAESMTDRGGVFDFTNAENPLSDHSFVYVPYCTGDVHLGNRTATYADDLVIEHKGYINGLAALDHLVEAYPETTELLVTGVSAGSVPTPLFAALAADRLPGARIVTLADSSGAYPDDPVLNAFIGNQWGSMEALPDWPEVEELTVRDWGIPGLYVYGGQHAPNVTLARFDYAFDEVQASYGNLVGVASDELVTLIDDVESDIEADGVDLASYVAPGTEHTILWTDTFYELEVEGVRFVDWFTDLVEGKIPADVHCADCH